MKVTTGLGAITILSPLTAVPFFKLKTSLKNQINYPLVFLPKDSDYKVLAVFP